MLGYAYPQSKMAGGKGGVRSEAIRYHSTLCPSVGVGGRIAFTVRSEVVAAYLCYSTIPTQRCC